MSKSFTVFAGLLISTSAFAAGCPDFSGNYTNSTDKLSTPIAVSQTGCNEMDTSIYSVDVLSLKTDGVFRQVRDKGQTELEKATFTADSLVGETVFTVPDEAGVQHFRTTKYTTVKSSGGDLVTTYTVYDQQGNLVSQSGYTLTRKAQ